MRKIIVCTIILLAAMMWVSCTYQKSYKEPPELSISIDGKEVQYIIAKNQWNGEKYDREDTFKTIMMEGSGIEIPSIEIGKNVVISFNSNPPDKFNVSDVLINEKGEQVYSDKEVNNIPIEIKDSNCSFEIEQYFAYALSSTYEENKTDIRGYRMVATWGNNECEYAFIIKTFKPKGAISNHVQEEEENLIIKVGRETVKKGDTVELIESYKGEYAEFGITIDTNSSQGISFENHSISITCDTDWGIWEGIQPGGFVRSFHVQVNHNNNAKFTIEKVLNSNNKNILSEPFVFYVKIISSKPIERPTDVPTKESTEVSNEESAEPITKSGNDTWENYIINIIHNRDVGSLLDLKYSEINLEEYLKQRKISVDKGHSGFEESILSSREGAFLIDLNKDGTDELWINICQGSMWNYSAEIFEKKEGKYVLSESINGRIFPVKYNQETHFVEIGRDFCTKFTSEIVEYKVEGITLKPKDVFSINYTYDAVVLSEKMKKIIDNEFLNKLSSFEIPQSNIGNSNEESDEIELIDRKNGNTFNFKTLLWLTTVGYAPNEWRIQSEDEFTRKFKGIEQIETQDERNEVCFGFKFYKDELDNIFFLKASYPFYAEPLKDGDLILQLYKFNKDSVEEIEIKRIEPKIEIQKQKPS